MKKNRSLLMLALAFVLLLAGAYGLYGKLGRNLSPDQLAVQSAPAEGGQPEASSPTPGEEEPEKVLAPDFTAYDADGNEVHLSDYLGMPVVLNFWASWCGPCQSEMPGFEEAWVQLGQDIQFLMVNVTEGRETQETAAGFIQEQGYTFPVLYDTQGDASQSYSVYSLPTTFFIDAEGCAIAQATGAISRETLQTGIDMIWTQ